MKVIPNRTLDSKLNDWSEYLQIELYAYENTVCTLVSFIFQSTTNVACCLCALLETMCICICYVRLPKHINTRTTYGKKTGVSLSWKSVANAFNITLPANKLTCHIQCFLLAGLFWVPTLKSERDTLTSTHQCNRYFFRSISRHFYIYIYVHHTREPKCGKELSAWLRERAAHFQDYILLCACVVSPWHDDGTLPGIIETNLT